MGQGDAGQALFLLLPVGARAIGMGQTAVSARNGSEGVWWNPSAMAGDTTHEVAIHQSTTIVGQGDALSVVFPTRHIGTFAPSVNVLDLQEQESVDDQGNRQGVILPTDVVFAMTYAAAPSKLLALGATVKHVEARVRCSGLCTNLPSGGSSSNGADVGAQLRLQKIPLTIGAAVRNLGIGVPGYSPTRVDIGGSYRVLAIEQYTDQEIELYTASSVVSTTKFDSSSVRVGADIVFERKLHVRGGYVYDHFSGSGSAIGLGFVAGKLSFDLARAYGGSVLANDADHQPTYFSLRYLW